MARVKIDVHCANVINTKMDPRETKCAICYEGFVYRPWESLGVKLPCGHKYHRICYNRWSYSVEDWDVLTTCPLCRAPHTVDVEHEVETEAYFYALTTPASGSGRPIRPFTHEAMSLLAAPLSPNLSPNFHPLFE
jgi:hypothetical protein